MFLFVAVFIYLLFLNSFSFDWQAATKKSYKTEVRNVQNALIRAKDDVLKRASSNGIREESHLLGKGYFRSLFAGMGYLQSPDTSLRYTKALNSSASVYGEMKKAP